MNRFSSILLALDVYADKVNALVSEYRAENTKAAKIYNESTYQEIREKNLQKYRTKYLAERASIVARCDSFIEDIQSDLRAWVATPVPPSIMSLVNSLISCQIPLTGEELEAISSSMGSCYFGGKIIQKLAADNNLHGFDNFKDVGFFVKILDNVKTEMKVFIDGFLGDTPEYEFSNGVSKYIVLAATAKKIFGKDSNTLKAALIWRSENAPGAVKKTDKLSNEDLENLDRLFCGVNGVEEIRQRAAELAPDLRDVISLSKYGNYLPDEESEEEVVYP